MTNYNLGCNLPQIRQIEKAKTHVGKSIKQYSAKIMRNAAYLILATTLFILSDFAHAQSKSKLEGYVTSKICATKAEAYADAVTKIPKGAIPSRAGYNGNGDAKTGIGRWTCNLQWIIISG